MIDMSQVSFAEGIQRLLDIATENDNNSESRSVTLSDEAGNEVTVLVTVRVIGVKLV